MHPLTQSHARRVLPLLAGLAPFAAGCRDVAEPTSPAVPEASRARSNALSGGPRESIIFNCLDPGSPPDICLLDPDGGGRVQITAEDDFGESNPDLSTDGRQVVFTSDRDFGPGLLGSLYIMKSDGTGLRRLTFDDVFDTQATWSPNGRQVVFTRKNDFFGDPDLALINADGTDLHDLVSREAADQTPAWSPNGKEIAFSSTAGDPNGHADIHVIGVDGRGERDVTNTPERDELRPAWSPNGRKLAYAANAGPAPDTDRPNADIYVLDLSTGVERQLTSNPERESDPVWSRDGKRIYYVKFVEGLRDIFVMNADGSGQVNLTNTPASEEIQIHVR